MKKEVKKIIILGAVLILLLGVYFFIKSKEQTDAEKFAEEYTLITEENVFVYKDIDEIIEILENGTGIVYLGFPECQWCQYYVNILNEVAKEKGLNEVYYFNILEDRKNNTEKYQKIVSILSGYLYFDAEGNERVMVPDVTAVKDGVIIGHDNETSNISEGTPKEYWTDDKINALREKLGEMIIKSQEKTCTNCN